MLEIKEIGPDRFHEIWPIFKEVIRLEDSYPYPAEISEDEARSLWFAPQARVYNGYFDGEAIATRYIVPNKPGLGSHICNTGVMIAETHRGKGFGKLMNDFVIGKARELGFKGIQLNLVVSTNAASLHICRQNGFEIIGTIPGGFFYKRERYVDAYVMFRPL